MQRLLAIFSTFVLALVVGVACGDTSVDSTSASLDGSGSGSGSGDGSGMGSGSGDGSGMGMGGAGGSGDGSGSGSGMGSGSGSGSGSGGGSDCTPGFYKNHVPVWDHIDDNCDDGQGQGEDNNSGCGPFPEFERNCCEDAECTEDVLIDLQARGPGSEAVRAAAKAELDACFGDDQPCEDEY